MSIVTDRLFAADGAPLEEREGVSYRRKGRSEALRRSYDAKTKAMMGVTLPKYYNPTAINPFKYAEQIQKRKQLWQNTTDPKVDQNKTAVWSHTTFSQDKDGSKSAKFKKLMGIKEDDPAIPPPPEVRSTKDNEKIFKDLDRQYEMARISTHTHRGVGLGYASK
ncbi:RSRC2 [Cordylochernes scorpioides]|uniref:RSRC2 n=1 Tax=Cordylochernes scorpioides TaxID=51811 RepID=A0ABY6KEU3_9ARAC|nr:RSRC2 [Cordylochernes scorpioides]